VASTLVASFREDTSARSRSRGEAYARQKRVTIVHTDATSVSARVRGSAQYDVSLTLDEHALQVRCTCPYFDGAYEVCKHIWAVMVVADASQLLQVPADTWLDLGYGPLSPDFDDEDDGEERAPDAGAWDQTPRLARQPAPAPVPHPAPWESLLRTLTAAPLPTPTQPAVLTGQLVYLFEPARSSNAEGLPVDLQLRERKKSGEWGKPRAASLHRLDVSALPDSRDREILEQVCGATPTYGGMGYGSYYSVPSPFVLSPALQRSLVPRLCATERFFLRTSGVGQSDSRLAPIVWDEDPAVFRVRVKTNGSAGAIVDAVLRQGAREFALSDVSFLTSSIVLWRAVTASGQPRMSPLDATGSTRWLAALVAQGATTIPPDGVPLLHEQIAMLPPDRVEAPDELRVEHRDGTPSPVARVHRIEAGYGYAYGRLRIDVSFLYGSREVASGSPQPAVFDRDGHVAWRRDLDAEQTALARLRGLGVRPSQWDAGVQHELSDTLLPMVVRVLVAEGWRVEADGRFYRHAGATRVDIRSGIDWFEMHGEVDFNGVSVDLPTVIAAARKGDTYVPLGDGSFGLLPDDWLARHARVAALGIPDGDHVRFSLSQTALLDAWLDEQPAVVWDEAFARRRDEIARFDGIAPIDPPAGFTGTLRDYQREALGWFAFLRRFNVGGCLADEMGLGKTVMVLAALEARRAASEQQGDSHRPTLIVVPRSLVFNWLKEAERFAPALRVLDASGHRKRGDLERIVDHDLALVTYATLRRDIAELKAMAFDYVILDEAQAIKNASTASAKASRLLQARHRLALSGTPVENHIGELWSLFEFLNPGLLGSAAAFSGSGTAGRTTDPDMVALLARGLRPFILRRTKEQVASELPARTEQTLYCDLEPAQRKFYDMLRTHYRRALLGTVETRGLGRSKLQILEALLRLRQAACHPGLVDAARAHDASAKLDLLLERLRELVEDGRKVLVFSQFTSLLAIVRDRLAHVGIEYEYLDGQTRDREARVRRFQDTACPLFLISLKAGGLGLNLTAAEYVFLLDPWWNPAVEAQAIDRAHRIGQTKSVFAYRIIARDTVEEKVLELQATKRDLAEAVVRADESVLRDLKREDLELLLS
jgi:superfamily II DNA or RNA helicase